ncbi:MAG: hypothetical protein SH847_04610 [Roseiflexaceae bacterium]|nr:hypothetical protein [Roseiflexaceae bacterium]
MRHVGDDRLLLRPYGTSPDRHIVIAASMADQWVVGNAIFRLPQAD